MGALASALACCSVEQHADAGPDASTDLGVDATALDAGPVLPDAGLPLAECPATAPTGTVCIPAGWFMLERLDLSIEQPVYLDAFLIDETEVTNAAYAAAVSAGHVSAPPDDCGGVLDWAADEAHPDALVPQTSAWNAGIPDSSRLTHPVVCVTRVEAEANCESLGGRLPTLGEWIKAFRGPYPDVRIQPWGEHPSPRDIVPYDWSEGYAWVMKGLGFTPLLDKPITADAHYGAMGRSPYGVFGLSGNVSEMLLSCEDDILAYEPHSQPRVRPAESHTTVCTTHAMYAGTGWRWPYADLYYHSAQVFRTAGSPTPRSADYDMGMVGWLPDTASACTDEFTNDCRNWQLGFRCVYPL